MISQCINVFLLIIFISTPTDAQTPDLVIELFRHGARSPLTTTFDPNPSYWGNKLGELTSVGMRMQYVLGAALRSKYSNLLSSYDAETIFIRSTDFHRTIMSGYSHMAGIYGDGGPNIGSVSSTSAVPPYSSPVIQQTAASFSNNAALPNKMQPVPIYSVPNDIVLMPSVLCPMATTWSNINLADLETAYVFQNDLSNLLTYLQSQDIRINNFADLYLAGDNAVANKAEEISLPGNVDPNSQYYKDLKFAYEWHMVKSAFSSEIQRSLYAVNLLDTILNYIEGVREGTNSLNFVFLSAHDVTLLPLLTAFGITTKDCLLANYRSDKAGQAIPYPNCIFPGFASNLIFEFYNAAEPYIVLYYNGLPVPFCGNADNTCTFTRLKAYIQQVTNGYTPQDYLTMCKFSETDNLGKFEIISIVLGGFSFVILAALVVVTYKLMKKTKETKKKSLPS